jgi:hypothetical protein
MRVARQAASSGQSAKIVMTFIADNSSGASNRKIDMTRSSQKLTARCACGCVVFEAVGAPIVSTCCYCNSCQTAGRQIESFPSAPKVLDEDGGTSYLLYRRDRIVCVQGGEFLQEIRLKPDSPTRRMVATCCNSAILLDFTKGHWLTMYRGRFPSDAPPTEMRVMTRDRPQGVQLSDDVPSYRTHAGKLMWKLLSARIAMLSGR